MVCPSLFLKLRYSYSTSGSTTLLFYVSYFNSKSSPTIFYLNSKSSPTIFYLSSLSVLFSAVLFSSASFISSLFFSSSTNDYIESLGLNQNNPFSYISLKMSRREKGLLVQLSYSLITNSFSSYSIMMFSSSPSK